MKIFVLISVLSAAGGGLGPAALAQPAPLKGMVWTVPADPNQAEADLLAMYRLGVEAVRTGLVAEERLLTQADTLGLQLFQELPLDDLPATALTDTLAYAEGLLAAALARARRHASARHFGLARRSDTSDPRACPFFERLAARVRRLPNSQVYYLSAFVEDDRCGDTVDFVLLDARDAPDPVALLARRQATQAVPRAQRAGLGALGTWVRSGAGLGLRVPHAPEVQARYLESHLGTLFTDTIAPPRAVFVYRWRDLRTPTPSPSHDLDQPYQHHYGLITTEGRQRPAYDVVEGFYTGRQTTFAFPAGRTPTGDIPWHLLFGWLIFILIAASYALSPRFRYMVPRYFLAHAFYREAIRAGREVLLGSSVALLVAIALSAGVMGSRLLDVLRHEDAFRLLFKGLPEPVQAAGVALLAQPWMLILLLGSFYALAVALWTSLLSFASRRRRPLIPGQALMLVLWARWPFFLLMAGALIAPTLPEPWIVPAMLALAGGWVVATLFAIIRTLRDYAAITHSPTPVILAMGLTNPLMLALLILPFAMLDAGPALRFFWHLVTRT